jgi:hypothetical protein
MTIKKYSLGGNETMTCIYCGKKLMQPTVKDKNKNYHLNCYIVKDGGRIFTKPMLDYLMRKLEFMGEICDNLKDKSLSANESQKRYEAIKSKYTDCDNKTLKSLSLKST